MWRSQRVLRPGKPDATQVHQVTQPNPTPPHGGDSPSALCSCVTTPCACKNEIIDRYDVDNICCKKYSAHIYIIDRWMVEIV